MRAGNIPQGNKSKPKMVSSQVNSDATKFSVTKGMRVGNTVKDGQMDKPFKG